MFDRSLVLPLEPADSPVQRTGAKKGFGETPCTLTAEGKINGETGSTDLIAELGRQ
jgi:hypothetical protein